ncbi:aminopeptidase [Anaerostipes sp.]|uniref:aminopeptidase n=1 Tax=Anaerostipes sp. TaxID=1872530 RepID=UPI0025BD64B5|nr:aminopeptidase [Anaerostipes sp.]MBS7007874.1 aminopeptidase [Anaerostipes sp.]
MERHYLNQERLKAILQEDSVKEPFLTYFKKMAGRLLFADKVFEEKDRPLSRMKAWNKEWYEDVFPSNYDVCYGNPDYAQSVLGEEFGDILCFLYGEIHGCLIYAVEERLFELSILNELFLEIYQLFLDGDVQMKTAKQIIFDHMRDYSQEICCYRVREQLDPSFHFASDIVMKEDLSNPDVLYLYGEYISENEVKMLSFLNSLPKEKIQAIAKTYVDGFHDGFIINNIDMSKKATVNIRYHIGFEPVIREAVRQFREIGLTPILYRGTTGVITRGMSKVGYISTSPNPQFEYDHRFDQALYFNNAFMRHKLECYRNAYEKLKEEAAAFAGPACMETFGELPFTPENKEASLKLSEKQEKLSVEFQNESSRIANEYMKPEERSFTIIAYPLPEIGENFEEIFEEVVKVNTLDKEKYKKIQQYLIDALDQGVEVHIKGAGHNETDLYVALHELEHPEQETNFENCLADVNIPVGEVFTSPKLRGTNGVLHVSEVYLRDLKFIDLKLVFKDGMIEQYSCRNFDTEEENHAYIKQNLLYNRETLPMGEFAVGTNTTAYAMAQKYGILYQLPILIVEKMGPHFAVGDTCYSHSEETEVHNPDGKEIVAKSNERSVKGEYFNCHTDITIPYEELDSICVIGLGGTETLLIESGKFVLPGTEILNEPLT